MSLTRQPLARVASALTLMAALSACEALEVPSEEEAKVCSKDEHCGGSEICDLEFCRVDGDSSLMLAARVLPPASLGLVEQQIPTIPMSQGPALLVTLVEPAVLSGAVKFIGNPLVDSVPGVLEASTEGDISGLSLRFQATSADSLDEDDHGYELRLLPGRSYGVVFRPADPLVPPYAFELSEDQVVSSEVTILLPAEKDYELLHGFVRLGDIEEVAGARVTVILEDGTSLPPVETQDNGFFERWLPPTTSLVRVRVAAPAEGPVFPDWESEPLEITGREGDEPPPSVALHVPQPASGASFEAKVQVLSPSGAALPSVPLALLGTLDEGIMVRTALTDAEGSATFTALAGSWQVRVSVPPTEPWASRVVAQDLTAAALEVVVTLEERPVLSGTVKTSEQQAVTAGTVTAIRRPDESAGLTVAPPPFKAPLEADGSYLLAVDPGTYDIQIRPEASTGAPADVLGGLLIEQDQTRHFGLRPPDLAHITVADPDGNFLEDVTVELLVPQVDADPQAVIKPPKLLTKGVTGEAGFVDLVVPFEP